MLLTGVKKRPLLFAGPGHEMFSPDHIGAIVELVNRVETFARSGSELDLTVNLAIRLVGETQKAYTFHFVKGKIEGIEAVDQAPFVISASAEIWQQIFKGNLDPFVAAMQKKNGVERRDVPPYRWYVPFTRLFALFKEVKIN
jgi:putative sterol carrier protein